MTTQSLLVLSIGFLAQAFFSARMLVQWMRLVIRLHFLVQLVTLQI